jgi:spore coat polysaccharide biosynthesis protein SpsF
MLALMLERVRQAKQLDDIVIATSESPKDDAVEQLARKIGVKCFRGSEDDVLKRVCDAVKFVQGDHIVELWGDTPLIDPKIIDDAVSFYMNSDLDCVGTCLDKTFPWGMSLLVFSYKILAEIEAVSNDPVDRENVSNYIYEHPEKYKTGHLPCPADIRRPEVRLTVDEIHDLELVTKIFEALYPVDPRFDTKDILRFIDANPGLLEINNGVKQKRLRV